MEREISWYLTIFIGIILLLLNQFNCEPVVQIGDSYIHGQSIENWDFPRVDQFLSVPYAQSPVGELRFQKPVPIDRYPEDLINMPPDCPQYTERPYPWYDNSSYKNEDCLYLNIWTPSDACPENTKAVMYWIHGGGFRYDSIQNEVYNGSVLAAVGDIIVVTVNYRLGVFGFFTAGTNDAPGNVGIWDMLEGLRWVNKNIGYFGGDASRITIAGQSAGSIAVGLLAVSPLTKGLFRRQIMQSSSPTYLLAENNTRNMALSRKLAEIVGCADDCFTLEDNPQAVTECIRNIDAKTLSEYDFKLLPTAAQDFVPAFGDEILPENPRKAIFSGKFQCTDLFIGHVQDETGLLVTTGDPQIFGFFGEKNPSINKTTGKEMIQKIIKELYPKFPDPELAAEHYLPKEVPENACDYVRQQLAIAAGDSLVICPDIYHAEQCAKKGGNVYSYFWIHRPSTTPWAPWMGAVHFSEIQFIFGRPFLHSSDYQAKEFGISWQMIQIWSNFVKNGKPNFDWPWYSRQNPTFKYLGENKTRQQYDQGPHQDHCEFFRPYFTP